MPGNIVFLSISLPDLEISIGPGFVSPIDILGLVNFSYGVLYCALHDV